MTLQHQIQTVGSSSHYAVYGRHGVLVYTRHHADGPMLDYITLHRASHWDGCMVGDSPTCSGERCKRMEVACHNATPYWLDALAELLRDVDEHTMWQWLDETYPDAMTADQVLADCREGINLGQRLAAREPGRPARGGIVSPWRPRLVGERPETGGAPDA